MDTIQTLAPPPRHPREDLHRFVNNLNVQYNIGLPIPDPALSPSKRRQQRSTSTRLYTRLEIHFYQGGVEALHSLTKTFDGEAKNHWSRWVKKPKGDPDTLPKTSSAPPFAANDDQREWLRSLFHQVLDRAQPTRSFSRTQSGPAAYSMERTAFQTKRVADTDLARKPTKRSRPVEQNASAALSKANDIFVAPKPVNREDQHRSTRTEESLEKSFLSLKNDTTMSSSTYASKSFFPSVFSNQDPGPVSTQDTMEASTQEQQRRPDTSSQMTVTSSDKEALYKSFDLYDKSAPTPAVIEADRPSNTQPSRTQNSEPEYLGPTSSELATISLDLHSNAGAHSEQVGHRKGREPLHAEPKTIESRLHFSWRMCILCAFLVDGLSNKLT